MSFSEPSVNESNIIVISGYPSDYALWTTVMTDRKIDQFPLFHTFKKYVSLFSKKWSGELFLCFK